jgi:hypothetical protein
MLLEYFHIINYQRIPAKGYGVGVNEDGLVQSTPYDMPEINWMVGRPIADIIKRVGENGVIVRINDLIKNENE